MKMHHHSIIIDLLSIVGTSLTASPHAVFACSRCRCSPLRLRRAASQRLWDLRRLSMPFKKAPNAVPTGIQRELRPIKTASRQLLLSETVRKKGSHGLLGLKGAVLAKKHIAGRAAEALSGSEDTRPGRKRPEKVRTYEPAR